MCDLILSHRFRRQLGEAIADWNFGEKESLMGLIQEIQAEAFADGCRYVREHVDEMLNFEREAVIGVPVIKGD